MKLATIADLHLQGRDYRTRMEYVRRFLREAKKAGCQAVLCAGDVFEREKVGDRYANASEIAFELGQAITQAGLPWFITKGNHDGEREGPGALGLLYPHRLVYVIHDHVDAVNFGGVGLVGIPWGAWRNTEDCFFDVRLACRRLRQTCEKVIVFGHLTVLGASYGHTRAEASTRHWTPAPSDLGQLDADWVLLGHVHKRQSWSGPEFRPSLITYIGALTRLKHGEAGNPDGWLLVDTGWHEHGWFDMHGPRYVTVTDKASLQELQQEAGEVLHVRLEEPLVLPEDKRKKLTSDKPVEMLKEWGEGRPELDGAVAELEKLLPNLPSHPSAAPTIEKILGVWMTGYGLPEGITGYPFRPGWNAILGPNRSGKTTLLEAPYAALFGRWPSPGRDRWNSIADEEAESPELAVLFKAGGREWYVRRNEKSFLVHDDQWKNGLRNIVAGPGANQATEYITKHFGDAENWLRLCFLAQSPSKDLVDAGDTARMETLRELLELDELDNIEAEVKKQLKALPASQAESLRKQIAEAEAEAQQYGEQAEFQAILAIDYRGRLPEAQEKAQAQEGRREMAGRVATLRAERDAAVKKYETTVQMVEQAQKTADQQKAARHNQEELIPVRKRVELLTTAKNRREELNRSIHEAEQLSRTLAQAGCKGKGPDGGYLECALIDHAAAACNRRPSMAAELEKLPDTGGVEDAIKHMRSLESTLVYLERPEPDLATFYAMTKDAKAAIDVAQKAVDTAEAELLSLPVEKDWNAEVARLQAELDKANEEGAKLRGRAEQARATREKLVKKLEEEAANEARRASLEFLQAAFHKEAIPASLVAAALPGLQDEIDAFSDDLPDGFRLVFGSAKESGKGLPIWLARNGKMWDVRGGSGAEKGFARLLLRCSLLSWLARRGRAGGLVMMDEPTAAMDPEFSEHAADLLKTLRGREQFEQVILATHDDQLAEEADYRIKMGVADG